MTQPTPYRYHRRSTTRWLAPNRFQAICVRCATPVAAGQGETRFDGARWIVRHPGGRCHTVEYTRYVSMESPEWQRVRHARLEYAGGKCEWRVLLLSRCKETSGLECHHRHYLTLGHEPLKDVIILCKPHHNLADRRRRSWGKWPLFGRPFRTKPPVDDVPVPPEALPPPPPPR